MQLTSSFVLNFISIIGRIVSSHSIIEVYRGDNSVILDGFFLFRCKLGHIRATSIHQCIEMCFYWSQCRSVNYHKIKGNCRFNCYTKDERNIDFDTKSNSEYTDINIYPFEIAGNCYKHTCLYNQICVPIETSGYECIPREDKLDVIENLHSRFYDFEIGLCGWRQDDMNDIHWRRISGSTETYGTGPTGDHTTGNGYYIYMNAKRPSEEGHKARLISDYLPANKTIKVNFWYHMWSIHADNNGALNMFIQTYGNPPILMFSTFGNQGQEWLNKEINISSQDNEVVIIFEAIRGYDRHSDICLDDINITVV